MERNADEGRAAGGLERVGRRWDGCREMRMRRDECSESRAALARMRHFGPVKRGQATDKCEQGDGGIRACVPCRVRGQERLN